MAVLDRISAVPKYFGQNKGKSLFRPKHFGTKTPNFGLSAENFDQNSNFAKDNKTAKTVVQVLEQTEVLVHVPGPSDRLRSKTVGPLVMVKQT